ncbi:hypothetical protein [Mycolicibacterium conceptionense]|jgi:hypothetical protein|uniref:hypothetical protein n=1 Tax=Mycolicibacterium conceptionense TaxID=451644 RepID=UPI0010395893|nr:hypothetical protein [Mycolicibacterium conceptionense]
MNEQNSLVPNAPRRLDTLEELSALPDGTVVIWHSRIDPRVPIRQAGVLDTWDEVREIRPISMQPYEFNTSLEEVELPVWVVTFDDSPAGPC